MITKAPNSTASRAVLVTRAVTNDFEDARLAASLGTEVIADDAQQGREAKETVRLQFLDRSLERRVVQ